MSRKSIPGVLLPLNAISGEEDTLVPGTIQFFVGIVRWITDNPIYNCLLDQAIIVNMEALGP
jgi:hypothetical protein